MAGMMMKVVCVMVACMVLSAPYTEAITCGQVTANLAPCIMWLRGPGTGAVPGNCCSGVKGLKSAAKTTSDLQTACGCLKNSYSAIPGIKANNAATLPGKCGVSIPYKISPTTDCSKIK